MVYQAQGATISSVDTAAYGAVTSLGNAGRYEMVSVLSRIHGEAKAVDIVQELSPSFRGLLPRSLMDAGRMRRWPHVARRSGVLCWSWGASASC